MDLKRSSIIFNLQLTLYINVGEGNNSDKALTCVAIRNDVSKAATTHLTKALRTAQWWEYLSHNDELMELFSFRRTICRFLVFGTVVIDP